MGKACLVDTTRCIGCRACQVVCKHWNDLEAEETRFLGVGGGYENPPALSSRTFTRITFHEIIRTDGELDRSVFVKRQCMHCEEPACAAGCPVGALEKTGAGPVTYYADKCIGCRYCMMVCPFDVPTLEWHESAAFIGKCTFCEDRISEDLPYEEVDGAPLSRVSRERHRASFRVPACAKACPSEALLFGERDALLAEARKRIEERKRRRDSWQYIDHIYGEKEVGGTNWLYLASVPFEELGFRTDLGERAYPSYTDASLRSLPLLVVGMGAALSAAYWVSERRRRVEQESRDQE